MFITDEMLATMLIVNHISNRNIHHNYIGFLNIQHLQANTITQKATKESYIGDMSLKLKRNLSNSQRFFFQSNLTAY